MKRVAEYLIHVTLIVICCIPLDGFGQASKNFERNKKTYNQLVKVFKNTPVLAVDSTNNSLGKYEELLKLYLDIDEINKKFNEPDSNSFFSTQAKYSLQQMLLASLHSNIKYLPSKYLKIIPEYKSKTLNSNWRQNSNAEEIEEVENSVQLTINNKKKSYTIMSLTFSEKNNKLLYITPMSISVEAVNFINKINKAK